MNKVNPTFTIVNSTKKINRSVASNVKSKPLAFNSWAPEVINGRLAMLGVVSGKGYEIMTHSSVFNQPHAFEAFVASSVLVTLGSLKAGNPENIENICEKPFTPKVEMLNGRVAMLGILCSVIYYFTA